MTVSAIALKHGQIGLLDGIEHEAHQVLLASHSRSLGGNSC
jgi:hypothetical protein